MRRRRNDGSESYETELSKSQHSAIAAMMNPFELPDPFREGAEAEESKDNLDLEESKEMTFDP